MKITLVVITLAISSMVRAQDTLSKLKATMDSATLYKVEIESHYPGGDEAWNLFLQRTIRYPAQAVRDKIQGIVRVQFIVDVDGKVYDIRALSGPEDGGLREEAERVIKRSGKWVPALQHGRYVKSYKNQPFVFRLN